MELKNVTFLVIGELYLAINTNLEKVFLLDNITFDVLKAVIRQIKRCLFRQIKTGLSEHLTMG